MYLNNVVLIGALVWLILMFLALTAVAISPQILFNFLMGWPTKLALKIRNAMPEIFIPGEELWKGIDKKIGESRRLSIAFWLTRIFTAIMAIAAAFMITWILGLFQIFWFIIKSLIL
jgi:hypothetical protein